MEVDRKADIKEIEKGIKNKFKWTWLEEKDKDGYFLSDYVRKLNTAGQAKCIICNEIIKYASSGKKAVLGHGNTENHRRRRKERDSNQTLSSMFKSQAEMEKGTKPSSSCNLPYGAPPNVHDSSQCPGLKTAPRQNVSVTDRIANAEALITSFTAEHSLPFSMSQPIIDLAKELARDPTALNSLSMQRTTCSYKLVHGLAEVTRKRIVQDLRDKPFSINLDECTNNSNEKILSILVSYFDDEVGECIVQHYASISMTTVNAETVFLAVKDLLMKDNIPMSNIVSTLSDSHAW